MIGRFLAALLAVSLAASTARAADFDARPWLDDLAQLRGVLETRYANRDWLEHDRGVDLGGLLGSAADALKAAHNETEARAALDRLIRRIGDGHVEIDWAKVASGGEAGGGSPCDRFDPAFATPGPAAGLPGYRALPADPLFPAGIAPVGTARIGVLRIAVFGPQADPSLCPLATQTLKPPPAVPCDEVCGDRVMHQAEVLMTGRFEARLRALKAAGATVLLVDLSDNGGGSEWAEAAARMVTARPLRSERLGFVRGAQWIKEWGDLEAKLRIAADGSPPADKARLLALAAQVRAARAQAGQVCDGTGCERLGRAGFATGLVPQARASTFAGKPWGEWVFSPAEYPYRDGVWRGPLIVLVNQETWSAAEEFAAILQDNRAGVILGERTGGAGCGHTDGAQPVVLANSRAKVSVPDCVRFRADGSNEVRGIIPDVLVGSKLQDGKALKAQLIAAKLPEAIRKASAAGR